MKAIFLSILLALVLATGAQAVCNDCNMQVTPVRNSLCAGESAVYEIRLSNAFDQSRAITLYAAGDMPLTSDIPSQVVLQAYEIKTIRATFTPATYVLGQHRISLKATGFATEDSDDAVFYINDCYATDLQILQPSVSLCQDSAAKVDYVLTNTGQKEDQYELSVSGVPEGVGISFNGTSASLAPGASRSGSITVRASGNGYGQYPLQLNVRSKAKSFSRQFVVELTDCYQVSVGAPTEFVSCPDAGLEHKAYITNNGRVQDTYSLSASGCRASLSTDSMTLSPGETKELGVLLDKAAGSCDLIITATSRYGSSSAATKVTMKKCYDVAVALLPASEVKACRGETIDYTIKVTNTGFYQDTYRLSLQGMPAELTKTSMSLRSGEYGTSDFTVRGTWCVSKDIPFKVTAAGRSSATANGLLAFLPVGEQCAALELSPAQTPIQIDCSGDAYVFYVKNTGYTKQEVTLSVKSPQGYIVQPARMTLQPYGAMPASVYIEPADGNGTFTISIIATDQYRTVAYLDIDVNLTGPVCTAGRFAMQLPVGQVVQPPVDQAPQVPAIGGTAPQASQTLRYYTPAGGAIAGLPDPVFIAACLGAVAVALFVLILLTKRKKSGSKGSFSPGAGKSGSHELTDAEHLLMIKQAITDSTK